MDLADRTDVDGDPAGLADADVGREAPAGVDPVDLADVVVDREVPAAADPAARIRPRTCTRT